MLCANGPTNIQLWLITVFLVRKSHPKRCLVNKNELDLTYPELPFFSFWKHNMPKFDQTEKIASGPPKSSTDKFEPSMLLTHRNALERRVESIFMMVCPSTFSCDFDIATFFSRNISHTFSAGKLALASTLLTRLFDTKASKITVGILFELFISLAVVD